MARIKSKGLEEYINRLEKLGSMDNVTRVEKMSIYDGARVVADAIDGGIETIPTVDKNAFGSATHLLNGLSAEQIQGLKTGLGIATMRQGNNGWDTLVSFGGYNSHKTEKYPNGQPNAMIAASVESGTSFRAKNPFITKAVRNAKARAEAAMEATAENQFNQIMEGHN